MKWIFSPAITWLMHQRNNVKMSLIGVFFCIPLAISVFAPPQGWGSATGVALIASFAFAWYYLAAMYLTSDESWATVNLVARRLSENDLRAETGGADLGAQRRRLGNGQFGGVARPGLRRRFRREGRFPTTGERRDSPWPRTRPR